MKAAFLVGLLFLIYSTTAQGQTMTTATANSAALPRGIRNNNPLNIRYSAANDWQGQTGTDGEYAIFSAPEYGIRAAAKLLNNYVTRYGLRSVRSIINRWAPPSENNTGAYVDAVAKKLNVHADDVLLWPTSVNKLIDAMTHHENGIQPYSAAQIEQGVLLAGIR